MFMPKNKKGAFGGVAGDFVKNPGAVIVAFVLAYVGVQFLSAAIAEGGIVDLFFNGIESTLNSTGFTGLSTLFNTGGAAYLLLGVGVIVGAIALLSKGSRR